MRLVIIAVLVLLATIATVSNAQVALTASIEYGCGQNCTMGQSTTAALTLTDPTDIFTGKNSITISWSLPWNATLSDCVMNNQELDYEAMAPIANYPSTYVVGFNLPSALTKTTTMYCNMQFPPGPSSASVGASTTNFPISVITMQGDQNTILAKATYNFIWPTTIETTELDAVFMGGKGTRNVFVAYVGKLPFQLYQFDRITINKGNSITSDYNTLQCSITGSALTLESTTNNLLTFSIGQDTPLAEDAMLSCEIVTPATISSAEVSFEMKVYRMRYQGLEMALAPHLRYTINLVAPAPLTAVVGGTTNPETTTYGGSYPEAFIAGQKYAIQFGTTQFNSLIEYRTVSLNDDAGTIDTYAGHVVLSVPQDFYLKRETTSTVHVCTHTLNTMSAPSYNNPTFTVTTKSVTKTIGEASVAYWDLTLTTNTALTYAQLQGQNFRIYCNGFVLAQTSMTLPHTPKYPMMVNVYLGTKNANNLGALVATNNNISFKTFTEQTDKLVPLSYYRQAVKFPGSTFLTDKKIEELIDTYRTIVGVPAAFDVRLDKQQYFEVTDEITVTLVIVSTPELNVKDVVNAQQTQIAEVFMELKQKWKLTQNAAQTTPNLFELPVHCQNNQKDEDELDVNCGGEDCFGCPTAAACTVGTDCMSGVCDEVLLTCAALVKQANGSAMMTSTTSFIVIAIVAVIAYVF